MGLILGTVLGSDDRPLEGVALEFIHRESGQQIAVVTGAQGAFRTPVVKAGDYTWTARADGFLPRGGELPNVPTGQERVDQGKILLLRPGSLSGKVFSVEGAPVRGCTIRAVDAGGTASDPARS